MGLFDFILFSAGSVALFPIIYFSLSFLGESVPSLDLMSIFISLLLSVPMIPISLFICKKIDASFDPYNNHVDHLVLEI